MAHPSSRVTLPEAAVPPLTRWGVSAVADVVFRALAAVGPGTAGNLARSLGLPVRQVMVALDELADAGAAVAGAGRVWRCGPVDAVVTTLRQRQLDTARARHALQHWLTRLDGVGATVSDADLRPRGAARPLCGVQQVRDRLGDLVRTERHEHLAINPEPVFDAATLSAAAPLNRSMVARGVDVHALGVPSPVPDAHTMELVASGVRYRELSALPTKLMIMDRRIVILPLDPGDLTKGAWEIHAQSIVDRFIALFWRQWDQAEPPRPVWTPPTSLTPREKATVLILAAGHTDATAAARLGVSRRTITYTISDLMQRYGADNRFQLGLLIGRRVLREHATHAGTPAGT